jgi:hypothetical protein
MAWNFDQIDTPANLNTALTNYMNANLTGTERGFFNNLRTNIALQLSVVQTPKARVQTAGAFDGVRWRAEILIDPLYIDPAGNIIGGP